MAEGAATSVDPPALNRDTFFECANVSRLFSYVWRATLAAAAAADEALNLPRRETCLSDGP